MNKQTAFFFVVDASSGQITDINKIAREKYSAAVKEIAAKIGDSTKVFEGKFDGFDLKVNVSKLDERILVSATDVSEIKKYQKEILSQISESLSLLKELEEKKRNIDAYLDSLYEIPHLKEKKEMFTQAEEETKAAFKKMEENLSSALADREHSEQFLHENLVISEATITKIRAAVALLKEEME